MPLFFQQDICSPIASIERELFNLGILQDSLAPDQVTQNIDNLTRLLNYYEDTTSWEDTLAGLDADTSQRFQEFKDSNINPFNHSGFPADFLEDEEDYPYPSPPNSPTNKEMHAYNGNLAQAQSFVEPRHSHHLLRSIRTAASHVPNPLRSIAQGIRQRFPRETPLHSYLRGTTLSGDAGDLRFASMMNQPIGMLAGGAYVAGKEAIDTVKDISKEYSHNSVSNKQAHIDNGNVESERQHQKRHTKPFPKPTTWDGVLPEQHNVDTANISTGPTNAEMHSYNGNIDPFSAMSKMAQVAKKQFKKNKKNKKSFNRRRPRPYYPRRRKRWIQKQTIAKSTNKSVKLAAKVESAEQRLAKRYWHFLQNPSIPPPRLGSSGSAPTKILHGFFKKTYNMAAPLPSGGTNIITNAVSMMTYLNPNMFKVWANYNSFTAPFVVCFSNSPDVAYDTQAVNTVTFLPGEYTNDVALKAETGSQLPTSRFLGGSISIECRCPMATVAPPILYGGLLPTNVTSVGGTLADAGRQLVTQTANQMQNLVSSVDMPGFTASSCYVPSDNRSLNFANHVALNNAIGLGLGAIPYVGMNGCPTTATITVAVSGWFEIQQNQSNSHYGGWQLGPKLSTEDVFDFLPRKTIVSNVFKDQGAKSTASATTQMLENIACRDAPPPKTIEEQFTELKQQISQLRLKIEDEEDEKYFDCEATPQLDRSPDTPIYRGLSKSTIDLAINLKKSLTPGSVTSKTVQANSQ